MLADKLLSIPWWSWCFVAPVLLVFTCTPVAGAREASPWAACTRVGLLWSTLFVVLVVSPILLDLGNTFAALCSLELGLLCCCALPGACLFDRSPAAGMYDDPDDEDDEARLPPGPGYVTPLRQSDLIRRGLPWGLLLSFTLWKPRARALTATGATGAVVLVLAVLLFAIRLSSGPWVLLVMHSSPALWAVCAALVSVSLAVAQFALALLGIRRTRLLRPALAPPFARPVAFASLLAAPLLVVAVAVACSTVGIWLGSLQGAAALGLAADALSGGTEATSAVMRSLGVVRAIATLSWVLQVVCLLSALRHPSDERLRLARRCLEPLGAREECLRLTWTISLLRPLWKTLAPPFTLGEALEAAAGARGETRNRAVGACAMILFDEAAGALCGEDPRTLDSFAADRPDTVAALAQVLGIDEEQARELTTAEIVHKTSPLAWIEVCAVLRSKSTTPHELKDKLADVSRALRFSIGKHLRVPSGDVWE